MHIQLFKFTTQLITITLALILSNSISAKDHFTTGPVFNEYGENVEIKGGLDKPELKRFKVVFDVYKDNESDNAHRGFNSLARFINMHVRAGVPLSNIDVAMVVHGKASYDLLKTDAFKAQFSKNNPSSDLVSQLLANDVKIFVCGQSSSFLGIQASDFADGVELSLSAMTANALLQQEGYTLNPF